MVNEPPIGGHLVTPRVGYTHHGIYSGGAKVIHYSGLAAGLQTGPVEEVALETFAAGKGFAIKTYKNAFPPDQILSRAKSRLGENLYDVSGNNCEHFCLWCILGDHASPQVERVTLVTAPTVGSIVGLAARGVVAASGPVAGLSGAGVMSGLASTGAVVGGGAVAGVALLGAVPGVAMASLVNRTVLADSPALEENERTARAAGRVASYVGVGAGTATSIAAIGALGTVGFSAAGITSGLAAIGGVVGGGMAAGVAVATAAPVVAAAGIGYGIYRVVKLVRAAN